jgi:hypothetical protein
LPRKENKGSFVPFSLFSSHLALAGSRIGDEASSKFRSCRAASSAKPPQKKNSLGRMAYHYYTRLVDKAAKSGVGFDNEKEVQDAEALSRQ